MGSLATRRALLTAALGLMRLRWQAPVPSVVLTFARWMDSWAGLGAVVTGMSAQGFNLELKEFPWGWRANFYPTGIAHSVVVGSAFEPAPWTAVQKAGWEVLRPRAARGTACTVFRLRQNGAAMRKFHEIWVEQREAARDICEAFGLQKALGYLIEEKGLNFLRASDQDPPRSGEARPRTPEEIKRIFDRDDLQNLTSVRRVGAPGHVTSDQVYAEMREVGAFPEDPVEWAEEILLIERVKKLLLP